MCGILALLNYYDITPNIIEFFEKGKNRGPENSVINQYLNNIIMGFHRLAINGLNACDNQPLCVEDCVLICNGEIYNFKYLYSLLSIEAKTENDCEIIIHLYKQFGLLETLNLIDGVYAFVLLDLKQKEVFIVRDIFGIRPLFKMGRRPRQFGYSSEIKMLVGYNPDTITPFVPGTITKFMMGTLDWYLVWEGRKFTSVNNCINYSIKNDKMAEDVIVNTLSEAVRKRVGATDRPIACLLSGGLDSSLIAALVNKYYEGELETYSIGLKNSEDLKYAKIAAEYIGTKHTEIILTEKEFLNAIIETIYAIESYDTTTVRASVGNYLVAKYIKNHSAAKVIFNGDGSDEVCGGYLYFHAAPNILAFDKECRRLLKDIHTFDVLRSDRSISSNGLEPRTPFLDKCFVQNYLSIPPDIRCRLGKIEKYLLRNAFSKQKLLHDVILFRKKEAFSDGVSGLKRSWYEIIQEYIKNDVEIQKKLSTKFKSWNIPQTDEQKYYRQIFNSFYNTYSNIIPYFWMPRFINATDASARTLKLYKDKKM